LGVIAKNKEKIIINAIIMYNLRVKIKKIIYLMVKV
jgi:hypothetical protein